MIKPQCKYMSAKHQWLSPMLPAPFKLCRTSNVPVTQSRCTSWSPALICWHRSSSNGSTDRCFAAPFRLRVQGSLQLSGFPGLPNLGVLSYLCPHPLTQNDQIRHGNWYGEGVILRQPCHRISINASRGLSATAEFLVKFTKIDVLPCFLM